MKDIVQSWRSPAWRSIAALAIVIGASCPATAADELTDLLPADPLAVVRVTGLGNVWDIVKESHALQRIAEDSPSPIIVGYEKMRTGFAGFQEMFTFNLEKTVKDLIGNDCALAVYEDNKGVFVSIGNDKTELADAANTVVTLERNTGKVENEDTFAYEGVDVIRIVLVKPNKPDMPAKERYHCIINNALIVSENLDMLKKVVDIAKEKVPAAESKELAKAFARMPENAFLRAYADVDRFSATTDLETVLDGRLKHPGVQVLVDRLKGILPMIQYATVSAAPREGMLEIRQTVALDEANIPPEMKALIPSEGALLSILDLAPENAVIAGAHQVNKAALWRYVFGLIEQAQPEAAARIKMVTEGSSAMFGAADFNGVLARLGDQVGVFAAPATSADSVPTLSIAVELKDQAAIPAAIRSVAGIAVLAEAQKPNPKISFEQGTHKGVQLSALRLNDEKLAGKLNPTLYTLDNVMVISSNTEAAGAIIDCHTAKADPFELPEHEGTLAALCRIDVTKLAQMAARYKELLMKDDIEAGKPRHNAEQDTDSLIFLLELLDEVTLYATHTPGRVDRVVLIRFAAPKEE